jgi:hypothetical protein
LNRRDAEDAEVGKRKKKNFAVSSFLAPRFSASSASLRFNDPGKSSGNFQEMLRQDSARAAILHPDEIGDGLR